jgi:PGF-CTERM protein
MTVQFPMTEHYDRPLDADQFGTSPNISQGDGYLDSHCIEMHGHPEDATIEYGKAEIEGEYADRIDVVGYIQQVPEGDGWDTDIDPVAAAEPYADAGGGWTYRTNASHGQVVVVLQLDAPADERLEHGGSNTTDSEANESETATNATDQHPAESGPNETGESDPSDTDEMPGFGVLVALVALSGSALAHRRT